LEQRLRHDGGATLQIILKVTEVCNIACRYCYFFFGGDETYKDNPAHISVETIDGLCRLLEEGTAKYRLKDILLIIHGGEPLMLKRERMAYLFARARQATRGAQLRISIQTNAMLIDDDWVDLIAEHQAYVGVSLDGPPEINDIDRIDKKGQGTYQRTLEGIHKLQQAAQAGRIRHPGMLCVVSPSGPIERIYRHFVHELGFRNIDFLLPIVDHDDSKEGDANALAQRMIRLLELYSAETVEGVKIRFFDKAIKSLTLAPDFYSTRSRLEAQRDIVFVVSSAGEIGPDDTLRVNHPSLMTVGLNVKEASLTDIVLSPQLNSLLDEAFRLPVACEACDFARVCGGGELYHRYSAARGFEDKSVHCRTLYAVHERLCEILMLAGHDSSVLEKRLLAQPRRLTV
jgi:uncharacterized protein